MPPRFRTPHTVGMSRAVPEAPATHFRLSPDSWARIAEAYRNGASARELAVKWKVSPSTIYRYACRDGFTKKRDSDAVARAHAQMIAEEEAADLARRGEAIGPAPDSDPATLRKRAMTDMARAMAGGRTTEAERLGRLILTLDKMSGETGGGGDDPDYTAFERNGVSFIDPAEPHDSPRRKAWRAFAKEMTRKEILSGEDYASKLMPFIEKVAVGMLGDRSSAPAVFSRAVFRWRAATFGPELARSDFENMRAGGWDGGIFNEDGSIIEGWDLISRRHPDFK